MDVRYLAATALALLLAACAPAGLQSLGGNLTGGWHATYGPIQFVLTVQPNGAYTETQTSGGVMTQQTGMIQPAGPGQVAFTVQDWQPKSQSLPGAGGQVVTVPVQPPPGGVYRIQFSGPDAFTLQDTTYGGVITYTRG